jgi:hypothetical protein
VTKARRSAKGVRGSVRIGFANKMKARPISRALSALLVASLLAGAVGSGRTLIAQSARSAADDVQQTIDAARKEIERYRTAGGAAGVSDHPAVKWDAALWAYRDRYPHTDAAAMATVEAIRQLVREELWDRAHVRVESLDASDAAWERVASVLYEEGIARKDFSYTSATLTQVAASTTTPTIKSAALLVLGRMHRRQGDLGAATRTLEEVKTAAPGSPSAEEADGLIYEIAHLSVGLAAPPISGKPRNGRGLVSLETFHGKPVVLVFWAST